MGKPFDKEICALEETYAWACNFNVSDICDGLRSTSHLPLLSIGSGGSYSAAELQATLHRLFFRSMAQALTPMELIYALPRDGNVSVWFMSASGNNVDIRRGFQHAALLEPRAVSALVGKKNTRLADHGARYQYTNIFECPMPTGKDGFLATNSLFGFSTIMYRSYCKASDTPESLPRSVRDLATMYIADFDSFTKVKEDTKELLSRNTIHVIYSPLLKSTAVDIESKFVEAGLGSVHLADIRNFAHGRHHWFSKNIPESGILSLTTPREAHLSAKTLNLLPNEVPKHQILVNAETGQETLAGLLLSMYLTSWRGKYKGIDPGQPGVPSYGSKIYRLTADAGFIKSLSGVKSSIERKRRFGPLGESTDERWKKAHQKFVRDLCGQNFGAIVFDYDGTLVDSRRRREPPTAEICVELTRLLDIGVKIGIATGRGKSIRGALQQPGAIPEEHWEKVIIGYYNGSDISPLSNDNAPDRTSPCAQELKQISERLKNNLLIASLNCDITERRKQVTIESTRALPETLLWDVAQDELRRQENLPVEIVRSSHSIDILAARVSKLAVVQLIREELADNAEILAIGDRGRWPGNDSGLLNLLYSLSVDETSFAQDRCWNLCPAGVRGPQATLHYLKRICGSNGFARFK
jgi:hypothetical protein